MEFDFLLILVLTSLLVIKYAYCQENKDSLLVLSVATQETDGFKRYVRSLKQYGFTYEILGLGEEWKGGNVKLHAGGGHKVNLLLKALEKYKDDENKIILFTDGYDVVLSQDANEILKKFKKFDSRIVFGAENFCWPDQSLEDDYPPVAADEKRFLNSGGFIGYSNDLYDILSSSAIKDEDDDQLFYTKIFLNKPSRESHKIKLDTRSEIFQNLNGAVSEVGLYAEDDGEVKLYNNLTQTAPGVIHGNGASKLALNRLGNYLAKSFSNTEGCISCKENTISLNEDDKSEWPEVTVGIFVEQSSPFLREFFKKFSQLNFPKNKLSVLIHNNVKYHHEEVEKFFTNPQNEYASIKYLQPNDDSTEAEARKEAAQECLKNKCKYYLSLDSTVHLDNPETLRLLIEQNRPILSPIMVRTDTSWSNVWGAINEKGFYLRSDDYLDIINKNFVGVWNLPYVSEAILVNSQVLEKISLDFDDEFVDPSMKFAANLRSADIFMYGTNMHNFGHLINPDGFNITKPKPEMYEIFNNFDDWSARYIHPEYYDYLTGKKEPLVPCPDVYWFPILSDEFSEDLITTVEDFGQWSGGNNNKLDPRIPGGYENVPTVDIHMTQVGFQEHWLRLLKKFIQPMQQKIFIGYYHDPPFASLNFVVRYRPGEQDHLTPHHDASTYTMNIALNRPELDFQGGGVRFVRYNCSVTQTKKGWAMIHPGRLTHYHEGLKVTGGTRYIMVSFIDP